MNILLIFYCYYYFIILSNLLIFNYYYYYYLSLIILFYYNISILLGEFEGKTPGRSLTMRTEPNPYKRMTPPST